MLSSNLRSEAKPIPRPNPRSKPSAILIAFFVDAGAPAAIAVSTVETLTGYMWVRFPPSPQKKNNG